MAALLVSALQLEVTPVSIHPDAPLFGEGLGLDSIDALEIALRCVGIGAGDRVAIVLPDRKWPPPFSRLPRCVARPR